MRSLSQIILVVSVLLISIFPLKPLWEKGIPSPMKPPHGENFTLSCGICHSTKGWKVDYEIYSFNHDTTAFPLIGQHSKTDCKLCHPTLIFSEANKACFQCHSDIHESTVGKECSRCHTPLSWLVHNITQIHQQSRFPLVGVHASVDCYNCHLSESFLRYDVIGTDCYTCHREDYESTKQPNHLSSGFSINCTDCHNIFSTDWTGTGFNHDFFPLTLGHALTDCSLCHTSGQYTSLSKECVSCHQQDYNASTNPNHVQAGFSTSCTECHTTAPGWKPALYTQHDALSFPVYSGKHNGKWNSCAECHPNASNYKEFTCISCHEHNQTDMDDKHKDETGYAYNSAACLSCHPTGLVIERK